MASSKFSKVSLILRAFKGQYTMLEKIFRVRYLALIINIFVIINTIGLIVLGAMRTIHAVTSLFDAPDKLGQSGYRPGVEFGEAIDIFLIALVFLVFAIGINILFIRPNDEKFHGTVPKWMRVKNFSDLKFLLMEAIIATAFIMFISAFVSQIESVSWEFLVIPISILLLAVSLRILKWKKHD